jgi:hypothetical protein
MKRLLQLVLAVTALALLSACGPDIDIPEGIIDVTYENVRYEGSSIVVDVTITNGTDENYDLTYTEFWLELPEYIVTAFALTDGEVCGAGFDIDETVRKNNYKQYEIEFTSEFIFISETDLSSYSVTLDDLDMYYYFEE